MKTCYRCGLTKEDTEYHKSSARRDGLAVYCKPCISAYMSEYNTPARLFEQNVRRHGISVERYNVILHEQGNVCAICGAGVPGGMGRWHIDHDHNCCDADKSCGSCVRGLLCNNCNVGLGHFKDSPDLLVKAAAYIHKAQESEEV